MAGVSCRLTGSLKPVFQSSKRPRCRLFIDSGRSRFADDLKVAEETLRRKPASPLPHSEIDMNRDRQQYTNRDKWQRFRPNSLCLAPLLGILLRFSHRPGQDHWST